MRPYQLNPTLCSNSFRLPCRLVSNINLRGARGTSFRRVTACGRSFIIVSIIFDAEGSVTNDAFANRKPRLIALA